MELSICEFTGTHYSKGFNGSACIANLNSVLLINILDLYCCNITQFYILPIISHTVIVPFHLTVYFLATLEVVRSEKFFL